MDNVYNGIFINNKLEWEKMFVNYITYISLIKKNIHSIKTKYNNLILIENNKKYENIVFIKYVLNSSLQYLTKIYKIKKKKFLFDINKVWKNLFKKNDLLDRIDIKTYKKIIGAYTLLIEKNNYNDDINVNKTLKSINVDKDIINIQNSIYELLTFHNIIMKHLCIVTEIQNISSDFLQ